MATSVVFRDERRELEIPVGSLEEFRAWAASADFPDRGRIDYLDGRIEVDMAAEELDSHGSLKVALVYVLEGIVRAERAGWLYTDRTRVTHAQAGLSAEPDVVFVSRRALAEGRVRRVPRPGGRRRGFIELEGSPDLVAEIVSDDSVSKDTRHLPPLYWRAGTAEFWLADARVEPLVFQIHRPGPSGWEAAPSRPDGFQYSGVFSRWFRLVGRIDEDEIPHYDLEIDLSS